MGKILLWAISGLLLAISLLQNAAAQTGSVVDYTALEMPKPGANALHILSPTVLELVLVNSKAPDPAHVDSWDLVDANFQFQTPATSAFAVTAGGQPLAVQTVGFKRRPFYVPLAKRDLRIMNSMVLTLGAAITDGQTVEVRNPSGSLWPATMRFVAVADPNRYSPAIHVNQEGYAPSLSKKASVGYYLGNVGELPINSTVGFKLVNAASGAQVYTGSLVRHPDVGYSYTPFPYQSIYDANFTAFTTPGVYRLVVPGLGSSLPFTIGDGIPMEFARAYALGLYHQRCGTANSFPFTRHVHNTCHSNLVDVPIPQSSYNFTWNTIASKSADYTNNPRHTAMQLRSEATQLYPILNRGKLDTTGGHHDAGDYSKYTMNSATLVNALVFAVDSFAGVAALDNLGIPESGDGISDLLQEAKWEADFLAKLQDPDGGFYFLVYPRDREYEYNVLPDNGDPQVVWPKNTAVTAAAVAALAQMASSPRFKQAYPAQAAGYLQKAQLGWNFLTNAIARFGKDGAYQKITHYGDDFMHDDELAWAACEMYLATTNVAYQQKLISWYDPSDSATRRWGWWRLYSSYGRACRSYSFAVRSGRLAANQLDATYKAKCDNEIHAAALDILSRASNNAYSVSFPLEDKWARTAGWFFPSARAFDLTAAYQIDPHPEYLDAIISNLNYEDGCNPINASFITGLGWKRQREIVHQYTENDRRVLPMSGIPLGAMQSSFTYLDAYRSELGALCFPEDWANPGPYPIYDRWADAYNLSTEFVIADQGHALGSIAFLATLTPVKTQSWVSANAQIVTPAQTPQNLPTTATLQAPGLDLSNARIVWEARDQEPAFGSNFVFAPKSLGTNWIEAEATLPDGRRVFATTNIIVTVGPPAVTVMATDAIASETGDPGVFTFYRSASNSVLTVYFTLSGTATNGMHYTTIATNVVFPLNAPTKTLSIAPINNAVVDGNRTVILTLVSNAAYAVTSPNQAALTIFDDEINLVPKVTILSPTMPNVFLPNTNVQVAIKATVTDDGKPSPPGRVDLLWVRVSGFNNVTFTPSNSANTVVKFSAPGMYTLRLTANDGQYTGYDEVNVVVDVDMAVNDGLEAYWRFSEPNGSTSAADSSGNNRTASVGNGAMFTAGKINNAIEFDGINDFAVFTSPDLNQISVAGWIRTDVNPNGGAPRIVDMPACNVRVRRDPVNGNSLAFESERSGTAAGWRTDFGTLTDTNWYHFAVAYDPYVPNYVPQIYLNGILQNLTEFGVGTGSLISNVGTGYIGNSPDFQKPFDGRIDELRIYNRILASNEVALLSYLSISNIAPSVNTGPDLWVFTNIATARAVVADDGKPSPPAALSNIWTQVSGPGVIVFSNATALASKIWLPAFGKYTLRMQSTDSEVAVSDEVDVNYLQPPVITAIARDNNLLNITWQTVPGRSYRLQTNQTLSASTPWGYLTNPLVASNTLTTIIVTNSSAPCFYRVFAQ